ncbi:MAG TPA: Gfo/Idh/MocA family oxidoreductase [Gemmatimonadales bacterium]|nr:Gfo/Idh/MocA family oxidoreductase [Gemmatimonadales bacterium]
MSPARRDAPLTRRDLLKAAGLASAGLALPPRPLEGAPPPPRRPLEASMLGVPFARHETVRLAIVGTGLRGRSVLNEWLAVDGVRITALCDIVPEKAARAAKMVTDAGQPMPALYTDGERDFERLVTRDDIDIVYTATPWEWHVPVCLAAMTHGKHAATEVPAASTIEDCWALVRTSEATRRHCLMMENCCYNFNEMLVDAMVKAGAFGDVLYAEAAYIHDLRELLFEDRDEGLWRRRPHTERRGNFYPTHGLGPVAWYLDIHKGDRFDYLVSMSTPERGLTAWREDHVPADSPKWQETYIAGDLNSSLVKTVRGKTILLQHNVTLPTPYSRLNAVRGTRGAFEDYPPRLFLEGQPGGHAWRPLDDEVKARYTHPLWQRIGEIARQKGGHGGMDYIMAYRLIETMREGLPPDFDVYDAAAWSAPWPLSEASLALSSAPVRFPDFTRGDWQREARP